MADITMFLKPTANTFSGVESFYAGEKLADESKKSSQEIAKNEFELARQMYEKKKLETINEAYKEAKNEDGTIDSTKVARTMIERGYGRDALAEALTAADAHNKMIQVRANTSMLKEIYGLKEKPYTNEYTEKTPATSGAAPVTTPKESFKLPPDNLSKIPATDPNMDLGETTIRGKLPALNFYNMVEETVDKGGERFEQTSRFDFTPEEQDFAKKYNIPDYQTYRTLKLKEAMANSKVLTEPEIAQEYTSTIKKGNIEYRKTIRETEKQDLDINAAKENIRKIKQEIAFAQNAEARAALQAKLDTEQKRLNQSEQLSNIEFLDWQGNKITAGSKEKAKKASDIHSEVYSQLDISVPASLGQILTRYNSTDPAIKEEAENKARERFDEILMGEYKLRVGDKISVTEIKQMLPDIDAVSLKNFETKAVKDGLPAALTEIFGTYRRGIPLPKLMTRLQEVKGRMEKYAERASREATATGPIAKDGRGVSDVIKPKATGTSGNKIKGTRGIVE